MAYMPTTYVDGSAPPLSASNLNKSEAGIAAAAPIPLPTTVKTSAYTAAADELVLCNPSAASFTVTLPVAPPDKTRIAAKIVIAPGANTVTIACAGTDKFTSATGPTSAVLTLLGHSMVMQYQASTGLWLTIADDLPLTQTDLRYPINSTNTTLSAPAVGQLLTVTGVNDAGASSYALTTPPAPSYPTNDIACFGDSRTASDTGVYPARVASSLGVPVSNQGISGQTSTEVAIRQGGVKPLITLTGNQIPATTTSVAVTAISPTTRYRTAGANNATFVGVLAGIHGTLAHTAVGDTWTFTRTTAGAATACPAASAFVADTARAQAAKLQVLWVGRNNLADSGGDYSAVAGDYASMVAALAPTHPHFVILSEWNATNENSGHPGYIAMASLNSSLASAYPNNYYDLRRDFIDKGLSMAGITPTAADNTAVAADEPPPSLMQDTIHPNTAGYQVVGDLVAAFITKKGWLKGLDSKATTPTTPSALSTVTLDTTGALGTRPLVTPVPAVGRFFIPISPNAVTSSQLGNGTLRVSPWIVPKPITLDRVGAEVVTAGEVGSVVRLGIYADDGNGYPGALTLDAGTIDGTSATVQTITLATPQALAPGLYWIGTVAQAAPTTQPFVRTVPISWIPGYPIAVGTAAPTAGQVAMGYSAFSVAGALPTTFTTTVTPNGGGSGRLFVRRSA